ncbi:putative alpha-L-fucosidase [Helianthus annuus]|nr:putative alpha-L-fucosidase [Helianthus annuus]
MEPILLPSDPQSDARTLLFFKAGIARFPWISSMPNFLKRSQIIRQKGTHSCLANRGDLYTSCVECNNTFPVIGAGGVFKNLFPEEFKFSSALYTFDIGHNDLTAGYQLNMSPEQVKAYIPDVISEFTTTIKNVYALGGRSFWIHNTGPAGCLPYMMDTQGITAAQVDKYGCVATINNVSQYFNKKLKEAIILQSPMLMFIQSNIHSLPNLKSSVRFGDPFLVCCGHGGKYNFNIAMRCGWTKMVNGTKTVIAKSCEDPSSRIMWDGLHFTEVANRWIYNQIADGAYSDPPIPLKTVCHRMI